MGLSALSAPNWLVLILRLGHILTSEQRCCYSRIAGRDEQFVKTTASLPSSGFLVHILGITSAMILAENRVWVTASCRSLANLLLSAAAAVSSACTRKLSTSYGECSLISEGSGQVQPISGEMPQVGEMRSRL